MVASPSPSHAQFRFSVRCHTDDSMVLACLRALCHVCEEHPHPNIGWGGTGLADWKGSEHTVKLRFTQPRFRERFIKEAERLLRGHWAVVDQNDNDPASPQRRL
jgi:hypothetical protein